MSEEDEASSIISEDSTHETDSVLTLPSIAPNQLPNGLPPLGMVTGNNPPPPPNPSNYNATPAPVTQTNGNMYNYPPNGMYPGYQMPPGYPMPPGGMNPYGMNPQYMGYYGPPMGGSGGPPLPPLASKTSSSRNKPPLCKTCGDTTPDNFYKGRASICKRCCSKEVGDKKKCERIREATDRINELDPENKIQKIMDFYFRKKDVERIEKGEKTDAEIMRDLQQHVEVVTKFMANSEESQEGLVNKVSELNDLMTGIVNKMNEVLTFYSDLKVQESQLSTSREFELRLINAEKMISQIPPNTDFNKLNNIESKIDSRLGTFESRMLITAKNAQHDKITEIETKIKSLGGKSPITKSPRSDGGSPNTYKTEMDSISGQLSLSNDRLRRNEDVQNLNNERIAAVEQKIGSLIDKFTSMEQKQFSLISKVNQIIEFMTSK